MKSNVVHIPNHHDDDHDAGHFLLPEPESVMDVLASQPPEWQVQNLLIRGQTCVIVGDSQSGKTFCALDLAACIATGRDFMRLPTKKGAVLYLAAEGGSGLVKRVTALITRYPDLPVSDLKFWRLPVELSNTKASIVGRARQLVKEVGLIVIDTLSQTFQIDGDENSSADMTEYVKAASYIAQELGCPVLIVHHCGKDSTRGARGASSLRCNVDTMIMVSNKDGHRTASTDPSKGAKQRDGEPIEFCFSLRQVSVGPNGETSCVIEQTEVQVQNKKKRKPFGAEQPILFEMAKSLASASKDFSGPNGRPVFSRAALKQAWVNHFKPIEPSKGYESKATRPLDKLIEGGFLAWEGQGSHRPNALWLADLP